MQYTDSNTVAIHHTLGMILVFYHSSILGNFDVIGEPID